jgi:DNA-binding HxlR family transcriptional regulator
MVRSKGSSPKSIKLIYSVLVKEPKCFEDIWKETQLHRNTVGSTLNDLVAKGLLVRFRKGHKVMYEMRKTKPPYGGWEIPWIDLMMTRRDWKRKWKRVDVRIRGEQLQNKWERMFYDFVQKVIVDPNSELVKTLVEIGMTDVPLKLIRENREVPFCLECLRETRRFIRTEFCEDTQEHVCPECGSVAETT